jgi:hypothetical protein
MHNSLVAALGGFTTPTRKTRVLFCREIFDYAELEEHPFLCNHLGKNIVFGGVLVLLLLLLLLFLLFLLLLLLLLLLLWWWWWGWWWWLWRW